MSREMIWQEAASWVDRLNGPLFDAEAGARFDRWMAASEDHRLAFAEISALWQSDGLAEALGGAARTPANDAVDAEPRLAWHQRRGLRMGAVAAALLAICLFALAFTSGMLPKLHETRPGELRSIVLADGSTIGLGGNSAVEVQYLPWAREVSLTRGEADFVVTRNKDRPFTVAAGAASVRVLGTVFHVDRQAGATAVQVTSGAVRIANTRAAQTLRPGQAARITSTEMRLDTAKAEDLQWQSGWHVADNIPLADLVEKLRRYSKDEIVLADSSVGEERIFGRFKVDEVETTLRALEDMGYVKIYRRYGEIILISSE